jgi:TolB-like protein/tetratricopeptide (TPR) repeat protein
MTSPSLLQRLKERKLVQWGIAYLCGAWVFVEATNLVVEQFSWPQIVGQVVTILAFFGFFITLVLAWYHGEKGRQKVSGPELLMVATLLIVAGVSLSMLGPEEEVPGPADTVPTAATDDGRPTIAVLHFDDHSPNPEDSWFAEGIRDDIRTALGRISALSVKGLLSADRFRDDPPPIREMASLLGVHYLMGGSARIVGEQIRVIVHLIDGEADEEVWSETYDTLFSMPAVTGIQGTIAQLVATEVGARIAPAEQTANAEPPTEDTVAYRLAHRARILWTQRSEPEMREAIRLFQEAIERDPNYAEAQAGLANAWLLMGNWSWDAPAVAYPRARSAVERAFRLDPSLPEAHLVLGGLDFWYNRDWAGAESHFLEALRLDPDHAYARYWYSFFLDGMGRHEEAHAQVTRARELDPLAPEIARGFVWHFYAIRDYERAVDESLKVIEEYPDFDQTWRTLCAAYMGAGQFDGAVAACRRWELETGSQDGGLALARALRGDREAARQELERFRRLQPPDRQHPFDAAPTLIALGDFDGAFSHLYRARDEVWQNIQYLTWDFVYDPIRSDSRFIALMAELNLPIVEYE